MGITVHSVPGGNMKFYILLGLFVAANAQGYHPDNEYHFAPKYQGAPQLVHHNMPHSLRWTQKSIADDSQVKCVSGTRSRSEGCRDYDHNDRLIRDIRCTNCRNVASVASRGVPSLDFTTCRCNIAEGEMIQHNRRDPDTGRIVRENGKDKEYDPEYRLVRTNVTDINSDMIRIVCDPDAQGNQQRDNYDA